MEYASDNPEDDLDFNKGIKTSLQGNGDFRSPECIELLKQADIVVTNPPFSLFREYVAQLMKYHKQFIIIGNKNALSYKEIFPLIKTNQLWIGYTKPKEFNTPNGMTKKINGLTRWFTNIDTTLRHHKLQTVYRWKNREQKYPDLYPKYDNYDAINIDKVSQIPLDYKGEMGVPITFFDKYNPDQFEIIGGFNNSNINNKAKEGYVNSANTLAIIQGKEKLFNGPVISKTTKYYRIIIKNKYPENY